MAHREYIVIGLGRFGGGLATTLVGMGHEVLGVDADPKTVQQLSGVLTHVVEADSTDEAALRQLGAAEFETAVVAIGTDVQASILTTSVLADIGIRRIVAKAVTEPHGRILERVGAHRVVFPERDMGVRVGHSLAGSILDYFELDPGFAIVETRAPRALVGQDARRGGGAQALRHHRRLHQARRRLVHVRDPRDGGAGGRHPRRRRREGQSRGLRRALLSPPK